MKEDSIILTDSQKVLKQKLDDFLKGPERIFLLTGKPGVGKSFMTSVCLKEYITADKESNARGSNCSVVGITLAHQAKNVLGSFIPNVFTFAKAYGLKEKHYEDGSRDFVYDENKTDKKKPIGAYQIPVFVHDEVSQYTQRMLDIVFENTTMFSKMVFIGDIAQLPPIERKPRKKDADSPVFDLDIPEHCKHELTERVRQEADNPILEISDIVREEILGSHNMNRVLDALRVPHLKNDKGCRPLLYTQLNKYFEKEDRLQSCVIAFRRKSVEWFNIELRNHVLNNPEESIIEGDIVRMLDNFYYKHETGQIGYVLENSEVFKVKKVYKRRFRFEADFKVYKTEVYVANIENDPFKQLILLTDNGVKDFNKHSEVLYEKAMNKEIQWSVYWDYKKSFCSCGYGYAITAYKAQGSTYDNVYIDVHDILMTKPLTPKRKLQTIYTAMTRARNNVYFLKKNL